MAPDDADEIRELFSAFGSFTIRRMFGGAGLFHDGLMFALRAGGDFFLKADEETIPALRAEGSKPFSYGTRNGRRTIPSFWRLPDRLLDDPEALADFARAALGAARRAALKKSHPRKTPVVKRRAARRP